MPTDSQKTTFDPRVNVTDDPQPFQPGDLVKSKDGEPDGRWYVARCYLREDHIAGYRYADWAVLVTSEWERDHKPDPEDRYERDDTWAEEWEKTDG